jgi:hypothetical protein
LASRRRHSFTSGTTEYLIIRGISVLDCPIYHAVNARINPRDYKH